MDNENKTTCVPKYKKVGHSGASGGVYFLALVGAAVFYLQRADTFWEGALGILKAIIWPAIVVYKLMVFMGM
jgi:hypothetical protein